MRDRARVGRMSYMYVVAHRPRGALAKGRTPQCCLPVRLTPSALLILAFSELTISGYPAYMCPCPTLQVRGCPTALTWLGVRMDSLFLSCMTLSITTSRPFIPTLFRRNRLRHHSKHTTCLGGAGPFASQLIFPQLLSKRVYVRHFQ